MPPVAFVPASIMPRFLRQSPLVDVQCSSNPGEAPAALPPYHSVGDVLLIAGEAVLHALPGDFWVKGEVVGYKGPKGGNHFFDLVERRVGKRDALLTATIWQNT